MGVDGLAHNLNEAASAHLESYAENPIFDSDSGRVCARAVLNARTTLSGLPISGKLRESTGRCLMSQSSQFQSAPTVRRLNSSIGMILPHLCATQVYPVVLQSRPLLLHVARISDGTRFQIKNAHMEANQFSPGKLW